MKMNVNLPFLNERMYLILSILGLIMHECTTLYMERNSRKRII